MTRKLLTDSTMSRTSLEGTDTQLFSDPQTSEYMEGNQASNDPLTTARMTESTRFALAVKPNSHQTRTGQHVSVPCTLTDSKKYQRK